MTKEDIIKYFNEGNFKEISREEVLHHLFQNGEIVLSDYLELQEYLKRIVKPISELPKDVKWEC